MRSRRNEENKEPMRSQGQTTHSQCVLGIFTSSFVEDAQKF